MRNLINHTVHGTTTSVTTMPSNSKLQTTFLNFSLLPAPLYARHKQIRCGVDQWTFQFQQRWQCGAVITNYSNFDKTVHVRYAGYTNSNKFANFRLGFYQILQVATGQYCAVLVERRGEQIVECGQRERYNFRDLHLKCNPFWCRWWLCIGISGAQRVVRQSHIIHYHHHIHSSLLPNLLNN